MQNNDFDKIFSHKFGQLPGEPYGEENWMELSQRMDMHTRRRTRWVLPALFFLLGALTGGNMFWWYQWREADRKLHNYEIRRTTHFQTDTLMRNTAVYYTDTIYQNVMIVPQQRVGMHLPFSANTQSNSFSTTDIHSAARQNQAAGICPALRESYDFTQQVASSSFNVQGKEERSILNGDAAAQEHTIVWKTPVDTSELATPPLSSADTPTDTLFENPLENQPIFTQKKRSPILYFARPRAGVSVMLGIPGFPHKISGSLWGAGIRTDVEIARNIRLGAEVAYQGTSLKADETEALEDLDIDIPDPGEDYSLMYWETNFLPSFTYTLHLRYEIPLRGNWTPWFGIGSQAITTLPFDIEYEYENDNNDLELHVPATVESSTSWQGIMIMIGAECRLNTHLYFGAEAYLLQSFREEPGLLDQQSGLKTSLLYKF